MNWRVIGQLSVAAIVGAGLFEAGRIAAFCEMSADDIRLAQDESDAPLDLPRRIGEPRKEARQVAKADSPVQPKAGPSRKKYADPPLAARAEEFISATELTMQNNDIQAARQLGEKAAKATRPEVRLAAVRMIAWFGRKAIAELTPFLADADESVAMEAAAEWKRIFANECSDREKLDVAALVMNRLTSETMLDELGVEDVFNEVDDEGAAVEVLIGVIKTGTPAGVKFAKNAYDTVTGEAWKSESAARKWIGENVDTST